MARQEALVGVHSEEAPSEDNLPPGLVELEAAILLAQIAQAELALDRPLPVASAAALPAFSARTNRQLVGSSVHSPPLLPLADCLVQHLKAQLQGLAVQEAPLAKLQPARILSVPVKPKASLASSVAPAVVLGAALREAAYLVVLARPALELTSRRRARTLSVLLARKTNRVSKLKIRTKPEVSSEAEALGLRNRPKHSPLVVCLAQLSLRRVVVDSLAAVRQGKARLGLGQMLKVLVEVFSVDLARNNRSRVCLVEPDLLEVRRTKALADCSVELALPPNHKVVGFSAGLPQTMVVVCSATPSSNRSPVCSEPANPINLHRTIVFLVDNPPTACSIPPNRANRQHNNLKRCILRFWMAILTASPQSGLDSQKPHHRTLGRLLPLCLPASA